MKINTKQKQRIQNNSKSKKKVNEIWILSYKKFNIIVEKISYKINIKYI